MSVETRSFLLDKQIHINYNRKQLQRLLDHSQELLMPDTDWTAEYSKQRKDRMQDAIDDYLNDDKVPARQTYEEILSCIDDLINYHKKNMDRATELKSLMMGNRGVELITCVGNIPETLGRAEFLAEKARCEEDFKGE